MTQLADFNGLKSSPEPIPHRSQSRDKGKGKAGLASAVTESESESDDNLGPSTQKRKHDTSYTRRPTGSLNTSGAGPSKQKSTPYIDGHLLFPTSDEEDEPPVPIAVGREPIPFSDPDPDPNTQPPIPTKTDPQPFTPPDSAPTPDLDSLVLEDVDPTSRVLVHRILEIMPDVNPIRVLGLIQTHPPTFSVSYDHGYGGGEDAAVERGGGEWEVTIKEQVARYVLLLCEDPKVDPQYEKEEDKRVEEDEEDSREDDGTTIECQYCFAEYPLSKIVQCPEAHLFCSTCVSTYVATQLGNSNSSLTCIHYSSCSLPFPPSELKRILPVKSYKLYEQLEQQKQIMQAGLMGFEMCPFCEWTCLLVSGEEDKPFICRIEAGGCGVVSCRECQKLDHLPKSCQEVEEENELSVLLQHTAIDDEPIVIGRNPTPAPDPDTHHQTPTQTNSPDSASIPDFDSIFIEDMDPASIARDRILGVIPNVEPAYLLELIETHFSIFHRDHDHDAGGEEEAARDGEEEWEATIEEQIEGVVEHVVQFLIEDPNYPQVDPQNRKGKGKRTVEGEEDEAKEIAPIDFVVMDRPFAGGSNYLNLALYHLQTSFPHIPKSYLGRQLQIYENIYTTTHLSVLADEEAFEEGKQKRPYTIQFSRPTLRKPQGDVAFEEERTWLDVVLAGGADAKGGDAVMDDDSEEKIVDYAVMDDVDDEEDDVTSIECQCCFVDYPFSKMVQCPETHLFCSTCILTYAATRLGTHNSSLTCIHRSSCSLPFPPSELKRILPVKLYELYERLEQQKQIMQAGLVGLEECPFCEWKCVLDASSEGDELFICGNEAGGCGVVSCRRCKKLNHLPRRCREEEHLNGRHTIEEAMTRALMRNCPKCQQAFIKEIGCNKMSCPNCQTLSCYVCRQAIKDYNHFNLNPADTSTSAHAQKCLLWDAVEERHAQEVKEAAEKAMREYKCDHPDVDESAIKVDLPEVPEAQDQMVLAMEHEERAWLDVEFDDRDREWG